MANLFRSPSLNQTRLKPVKPKRVTPNESPLQGLGIRYRSSLSCSARARSSRFSSSFALGSAPTQTRGRLSWQHWTASSRFSSAAEVRRTASSAFRTSSAFLAGDTSATHCSSYALIDASALSSFGHPVRCAATVATYLRAGEHVPTRYSYGLSAFLPLHGQPLVS